MRALTVAVSYSWVRLEYSLLDRPTLLCITFQDSNILSKVDHCEHHIRTDTTGKAPSDLGQYSQRAFLCPLRYPVLLVGKSFSKIISQW